MLRLLTKTALAVAVVVFSGCGHSGIGGALPQQPPDNAQTMPVPEQSGGVPIEPESLSFSGHLYVADAAGVQRFPAPVLTYSAATSPIVVDGSNRLYAVNRTCYACITVYAPGAATPVRTLNIIVPPILLQARLGRVSALALDSTGHLYVGVTILYCRYNMTTGCTLSKRKAALIYAPNASGSPVPRVVVPPNSCSPCSGVFFNDVGGLALDSHGDLIIASVITHKIYTIASPLTAPAFAQPIRTISGSGVESPAGLAVDSSGVLYVDNPPNGLNNFIAAFPVTANGPVAPTRVISVAGALSFGYGIAVGGGHLYIPDVSGNSVDEVSSLIGGTQTPLKLSVSSPGDVKLAP